MGGERLPLNYETSLPAITTHFMCSANEVSAAHAAMGISGCLSLFSGVPPRHSQFAGELRGILGSEVQGSCDLSMCCYILEVKIWG